MRALVGLLLILTGCLATGCVAPTADVEGLTGIGVDRAGHPVVLVSLCHGQIDTITVNGDRAGLSGSTPNPVLAQWSTSDPVASQTTFDPRSPGAWHGTKGFAFDEHRTYIVTASSSDRDAETTQVTFTHHQLATLDTDQVLFAGHATMRRRDFGGGCA
jgi:hypothetical protein